MIGSLLYCMNSLVFQIRNYALLFVYKRNLHNFCFWNGYLIIKWDHGWIGLILAYSTQILFTFNQYHCTFTVSVDSLILFKKSLFSVCLTQTPFRTLNLCFLDAKSIPEWKDGPVHQRQTLHLLRTTHDNSWHGQLLFSNGFAQRMSQSPSRSPPDQSVQRKLVSIITIWNKN